LIKTSLELLEEIGLGDVESADEVDVQRPRFSEQLAAGLGGEGVGRGLDDAGITACPRILSNHAGQLADGGGSTGATPQDIISRQEETADRMRAKADGREYQKMCEFAFGVAAVEGVGCRNVGREKVGAGEKGIWGNTEILKWLSITSGKNP
jgi:hypothetical protein